MELFLTILGGLACLAFMCTAAMLAPRLLKRSRFRGMKIGTRGLLFWLGRG